MHGESPPATVEFFLQEHSKLSNEHANNVASIKELCKIRDKVVYSESSPLEVNTLIELICTTTN